MIFVNNVLGHINSEKLRLCFFAGPLVAAVFSWWYFLSYTARNQYGIVRVADESEGKTEPLSWILC